MSPSNINVRVCARIYLYACLPVCAGKLSFCASQGMRDIKATDAACGAFVLILNKQADEGLVGIHCNQYHCKVGPEAPDWE